MSHPTRQALIEAGFALASLESLNRITVDAIVKQAGVAKGTFYVHFTDRAAFLLALHAHFHKQLRSCIQQAMEGLPPGASRLRKGAEAYLDECLKKRAVKALLLEARSEAPIVEAAQERNREFARIAHDDFQVLGWPDASSCARLFVVLVAEVALVEIETGQNEALRQALWSFARIEHA
ncbi:MAG TPA: TetR/AcrR family transcriptional regulator [Ktedonobacteraceae bacterium]|nr:TetR/AcrR family transcriptional regulator [Ktedonobacteraceae bacterium]